MCAHDLRLPRAQSALTSAEPGADDPWDELQTCRHVVFANAIAGPLHDVPPLTAEEVATFRSCRLAGDVEGAVAVFLMAKERKEARAWFVEEARRWSLQDVLAAAERVEAAVQARLWEAGGPGGTIADQRYARSLWEAQSQAHRAVLAKDGRRKIAKDVQRRASAGRPPLTVCCGRRMQRLPIEVLRKHAPDLLEHYGENIVPRGTGDHCGAIILDSSEPRAPKKYCARCRGRVGNTMNHGFSKRALAVLKASRRPR